MIVSHIHKVIFLKPRKVAGTSFEIALSKYCGPDDVITPISPDDEELRKRLGYRGAQNYHKGLVDILRKPAKADLKHLARLKMPPLFHNHISARAARELIDGSVWQSYLKLSIIRNPWDCMISSYFWSQRAKKDPRPFAEWCQRHPEKFGDNNPSYLIGGQVAIDRFIRYEEIEADIKSLEEERPSLTGLYETFSKISAKSGYRPQKTTSTAEMFASAQEADSRIHASSAFEIQKFGYTKTL